VTLGCWIDGVASFDCSPSLALRVALRMRTGGVC
jgi:hypothetical protein